MPNTTRANDSVVYWFIYATTYPTELNTRTGGKQTITVHIESYNPSIIQQKICVNKNTNLPFVWPCILSNTLYGINLNIQIIQPNSMTQTLPRMKVIGSVHREQTSWRTYYLSSGGPFMVWSIMFPTITVDERKNRKEKSMALFLHGNLLAWSLAWR